MAAPQSNALYLWIWRRMCKIVCTQHRYPLAYLTFDQDGYKGKFDYMKFTNPAWDEMHFRWISDLSQMSPTLNTPNVFYRNIWNMVHYYIGCIRPPVSVFYLENYMILVVREKYYDQNLCKESIGGIFISRNKSLVGVSVVYIEILNGNIGRVRYHWIVLLKRSNFYWKCFP